MDGVVTTGRALPPGPPGAPAGIVGRLGYYLRFASDPIGVVAGRFATYGDIYHVPAKAGPGLYVLRHPDHVREVLLSQADRFQKKHSAFDQLGEVLGEGLLTSDGETWKRHRRMIQPAFHHRRLAEYAEAMVDEGVRLARELREGEERDVGRDMMEMTLRVVSRTLFGHDVSGDTDDVASAMKTFQSNITRPDMLPAWLPSPQRRRMKRAVGTLDRIMLGIIAERRRSGERRNDLLQALLDAVDEEGDGGGFTEKEVRDELLTLFLAGHETTAHTLTWAFYLLSQNPAVRARLDDELALLDGRPPGHDDLARLPYTEQILKEVLRLYPPAYLVARRAEEPVEIGGYTLPAGSEVVIWIYMTHRDARWYPEPHRMRPERFTPDEEAKRPRMSWLPFGGGPRACIGARFAMIEAQLLLATLAQRVDLDLVPGHKVEARPRITLFPRYGMRMRVRLR